VHLELASQDRPCPTLTLQDELLNVAHLMESSNPSIHESINPTPSLRQATFPITIY
jgi:hypothetical protein